MSEFENTRINPQEGPSNGESLGAATAASCPTYYGGGKTHSMDTTTTQAKRTMDYDIAYDDITDDLAVVAGADEARVTTEDPGNDQEPEGLALKSGMSLRKRTRRVAAEQMPMDSDEADRGSDSEAERAVAPKISSKQRGGKINGAGRRSDVSRARTALRELQEEAAEEAFNRDMYRKANSKKMGAETDVEPRSTELDSTQLSCEELRKVADEKMATIRHVARTAKNLKGTFVRDLNQAVGGLTTVVEAFTSMSGDEESRRLRADNTRLRREVEQLKAEVKAHRREFSEMKASMAAARNTTTPLTAGDDAVEELKRSIISSVGTLINARFAGIEERLLPERVLRPPLAADRRKENPSASIEAKKANRAPKIVPKTAPASATRSTDSLGKKTKRQETEALVARPSTSKASALSVSPVESGSATSHQQMDEDGFIVQRKKKRKKKKLANPASQETRVKVPAKKPKPKASLNPPRTAAVVITLRPDAERKGVSYAHVLGRAMDAINLEELEIPAFKFRQTVTGARKLELPKELDASKADLVAEKLRPVLAGLADVARPTKCTDVRIVDLDDSVTSEQVAAAVAKAGNCAVDLVKARGMQRGPGGMGALFVRCPVAVAKTLLNTGRLLVGWSSARVQVLEPRPLRCYKCLGVGHTRSRCPSSSTREDLCFRCGQEGHKSSTCTNALRCAVCAHAGRPSGHYMGGRQCNPPKEKPKVVSRTVTATSDAHLQLQEEERMAE